jgi:hypothetical protein
MHRLREAYFAAQMRPAELPFETPFAKLAAANWPPVQKFCNTGMALQGSTRLVVSGRLSQRSALDRDEDRL